MSLVNNSNSKCVNCGRQNPGGGADMYHCPGDNSGHCHFSSLPTLARDYSSFGTNTFKSWRDLVDESQFKAEQQAKYDFYYEKEMQRLKDKN